MWNTFISVLSTFYTRKLLMCVLGIYVIICGIFFYYRNELSNSATSEADIPEIFKVFNDVAELHADCSPAMYYMSVDSENKKEIYKLSSKGRIFVLPEEISEKNPIKMLVIDSSNELNLKELEDIQDNSFLPELDALCVYNIESNTTWDLVLKIINIRNNISSITLCEQNIEPSLHRLKELFNSTSNISSISYNYAVYTEKQEANKYVPRDYLTNFRFDVFKNVNNNSQSICRFTYLQNIDLPYSTNILNTFLEKFSPVLLEKFGKMDTLLSVSDLSLLDFATRLHSRSTGVFDFSKSVYLDLMDSESTVNELNPVVNFLRSQNPKTRFYPLWVDLHRLTVFSLFQWIALIPVTLIMVHLSGLFIPVHSRLLPGYHQKHFIVLGIITSIYLMSAYAVLNIVRINPLVACVIAIFPFVLIAVITIFKSIFSSIAVNYAQPIYLMASLFVIQLTVLFTMVYSRRMIELDYFLSGDYPQLTLILILIEILAISFLILKISGLQRKIMLYAPYQISLNLVNYQHHDFSHMSRKDADLKTNVWFSRLNILKNYKFQYMLNRILTGSRFSPRQLWLSSHEYSMSSPWLVAGFVLIMALLTYTLKIFADISQYYFKIRIIDSPFNDYQHFIYSVSLAYIVINIAIVFFSLLTRRNSIIFESLHPWTRQESCQAVDQHLTLELRNSWLLFCLMIMTFDQGRHWYLWPCYLLTTWFIASLLIKFMMLLFCNKWVNIQILIGAPTLLFIILSILFYLEDRGVELVMNYFLSLPVQLLLIALLSVLNNFVTGYTITRWQNLEPAKLVRS